MHLIGIRSLLGLAVACLTSAAFAQPRYSVEVLAPLPGGTFSKAFDINELGDVAGTANDAMGQRAVVWNPVPVVIPALPGDIAAEARGINCKGQVIGTSWLPSGHSRPFFWSSPDSPIALELGTEIDGVGSDLNEAGQAVGTFNSHTGFLYEDGLMTPLNPLFLPNGPASASGINESGVILGSSTNTQGTGWVWTRWDALVPSEGAVLSGGSNSWGSKLNCLGHSTGTSQSATGFRAFLHDGTSMVDCGTIPSALGIFGYGINDLDTVVGSAQTPSGMEGFIWEQGQMERLSDLIEVGTSPTAIRAAHAINNRGEIACEAVVDGEIRGIILYPLSVLSGIVQLVDGEGIDQTLLPPLTVEIWDETAQILIRSLVTRTDSNGAFALAVSLPAGNYSIKGWRGTFLKKRLPFVQFGPTGVSGLVLAITNGDINSDNVVNLGDFDQLALSFGLESGDGMFIQGADLNRDNVCDLGDFDILARHFGEEGE